MKTTGPDTNGAVKRCSENHFYSLFPVADNIQTVHLMMKDY